MFALVWQSFLCLWSFLLLSFLHWNCWMEPQGCTTISSCVASAETLSDMMRRNDETLSDMMRGNGAFALASEVFAVPQRTLLLPPLLLKQLLEPAAPIYCLR